MKFPSSKIMQNLQEELDKGEDWTTPNTVIII